VLKLFALLQHYGALFVTRIYGKNREANSADDIFGDFEKLPLLGRNKWLAITLAKRKKITC